MSKNKNDEELQKQVPEQTAAAPAEETPAPSKRDSFRGRVSERYPDLNMDDEDAYYDQMGSMMDEHEGYERNSKKLRDTMEKSPAMAEMLLAARDQDDFDPVVWMVEQKGLDLDAVRDDPDYADKLAEAHNTYIEKRAKSDEIEKEMSENLPNSFEAINAKADELGLDQSKVEEIIGQMYQIMDDLIIGKIDVNLFTTLAKGGNYDTDVQTARDEGMAQGLNQKVDDRLRQLDNSQERIGGTQTPPAPVEPKRKKSNNMFLAD